MRVASYHCQTAVNIEERPQPQADKGDLVLKMQACGLCGSDILKIRNQSIAPGVVLGHELVGEVVELGEDVKKFCIGDRVVVAHHVPCGRCHYCHQGSPTMCRQFKETNLDPGGFSEYVRVPRTHVEQTAFKVPDGLSAEEAVFMEPLACCVRNVNRLSVSEGSSVLLIGLGSIGQMMTDLLRLRSCHVIGLDRIEDRCKRLKDRGVHAAFSSLGPELTRSVEALSEGRGVDILLLTAGTTDLVRQILPLVRDGGTVNLFASIGGDNQQSLLTNFYEREMTLLPSYSATPESLFEALKLIEQGSVEVGSLLTHRLPLDELAVGVELMMNHEALKVVIQA